MNVNDFPKQVRSRLVPSPGGELAYVCLGCSATHRTDSLLYTCPECGSVLMIEDREFERHLETPGETWRTIFDLRKSLNIPQLKGVYRFHEFVGPDMPLESIVWLGEGSTPVVEASAELQKKVGMRLFFKNEGQNPSASFKDRGMASAFSRINHLIKNGVLSEVLAICASTGDTSASAALYAAYLKPHVTSAVLLPQGKVTAQQLSQPLGNGAVVFEIPGVFDDCMRVVEELSETCDVALLNSKNAWRILGQESYSYEIAQDFGYETGGLVIVVPIGNAGNITAVMSGFLKFHRAGIIDELPKIIGVQSEHANPVFKYYSESDPSARKFKPVAVKPSVAQAAMIGNPVSMPRVIRLVEEYERRSGGGKFFVAEVSEQQIMDWQLTANRHGNIACTHGGETLAGLVNAMSKGIVSGDETAVLDSTAHMLKFSGFQQMYFENSLPGHYGITPDPSLINTPYKIEPAIPCSSAGNGCEAEDSEAFIKETARMIADHLGLKMRKAR